MNFNIYLSKGIGEQISQIAKRLQRSRNSIISEALEEWVSKHTSSKWPKNFFSFEACQDVPDFTALRKELGPLEDKDPLA